jgi:hypothetical protein
VCTPASKKYVVSAESFWPLTLELSPAGNDTNDLFGNAAFAAANDPYGDVITELRPTPHATNGATGSPPTTGALVVVIDDASVPASMDDTRAVTNITTPRAMRFELRTATPGSACE